MRWRFRLTLPHRSLRMVLNSAFGTIAVLSLAVSCLGIWGMQRIEQAMTDIARQNFPHVQAITEARIALLNIQSDNRQILFESNAAQFDADRDLLPADEQALQAAIDHVATLLAPTNDGAMIQALQQATVTWASYQQQFYADLASLSPTNHAQALALQSGTGAFRQQGWVVSGLLAQLQMTEQAHVDAATATTTLLYTHLFWLFLVITVCSFFLTIGLGIWVRNDIGKTHDTVVQVNEQLADALSESSLQHQEIQTQQASLLEANSELERTVAIKTVIEAELAEALAASQQTQLFLKIVFETVRDGLAVFSPDGMVVLCNSASQCILHLPPPSSRPYEEKTMPYQLTALDGTVVPREQYPIMRVLRGESSALPTTFHLFLTSDQVRRVVRMEAVPLIDEQGVRHGSLGVVQDISAEFRETQHNEILRSLAHFCASAADAATIAQAAVRVLIEGLRIPYCDIIAYDREREGYAHFLTSHDGTKEDVQSTRQTVEHTLVTPHAPIILLQVLATGVARFSVTPNAIHAQGGTVPIPSDISALTYLPLMVDEQTIGVLVIGHGNQETIFREVEERDLLRAVADELGLALHRALLYEDARRLALYDPLTGLHNHRALQQILQQEIEAAQSQDMPVAVVMLDVDHFRHFNEHYGHDVGDTALRTVAKALQSVMRTADCVARYGGEEFTAILPGIGNKEALVIAERMRVAIASSRVAINAEGDAVAITASLGVAAFPQDAATPATVLKSADIALYDAKHHGRNQVAMYDSHRSASIVP